MHTVCCLNKNLGRKRGVNPALATRQINSSNCFHQTMKGNASTHKSTHVHVLESPSEPLKILIISHQDRDQYVLFLNFCVHSKGTCCAVENASCVCDVAYRSWIR